MAIIALTISDKAASASEFERFALTSDTLVRLGGSLLELQEKSFSEAVVVSTCARTEVYIEAEEFHSTIEVISELLATHLGVSRGEITQAARVHYGVGAAEHLYRVTCGLESRILGEGEILGQVRNAYDSARRFGLSGPTLNKLFQEGLEVGKRARSTTSLASGNTSVASAGARMCLELVGQAIGDATPHIAVVGVGAVGKEAAEILVDRGAAVTVLSRKLESAARFADEVGCKYRPYDELLEELSAVDGAVFATSSPNTIFKKEDYERILPSRLGRRLVVVDLSIPRDVASELNMEPGVALFDLEGVNQRVESQLGVRLDAVTEVEALIRSSLSSFGSLSATKELSPVLSALYQRAEDIRLKELAHFYQRRSDVDDKLREDLERLTSQLVAKLMHAPATQLRRLVDTTRGPGAIQDIKDLFDL